ncbi:MAG TPA: DUF6766 family protein [Phycisphaerales bacterium]|nr:DUF6766 family protein [Phycisphaerales bacterium]
MPTQKNKYGFLWVTLALFLFSLVGHWVFGWFAFVQEAHAQHEVARVGDYLIQMGRDTLENWQSEFLQLIWQVAGLAYLYYVGSPQSKEGNARLEAKIDFLLSQTEGGEEKRAELDQLFQRDFDG